MLSSTSPTISSTPPSPAFHLRRSPYHAPRPPSSPSCASPRPPHTHTQAHHHHQSLSSSSVHHHHHHQTAAPHHSPVPAFARSPQSRRRRYRDSSTQYSPDGYPPTYRPALSPPDHRPHPSLPLPVPVPVERSAASAEANATDLSRADPQTAVPAHTARPRDRESEPQPSLQTPRQKDATAVLPVQSSPAKRARPPSGSIKVMPLKYETCDIKDLGVLVSDMLMELVRLNDDMPLRDGQLTRFHSR